MLLFIAGDGTRWEPTTVISGDLRSADVLQFLRRAFPHNSLMMCFEAVSRNRLHTVDEKKLEPASDGHIQIVTPVFDGADYNSCDAFKTKATTDHQRIQNLSLVFDCNGGNFQGQMSIIQKRLVDTEDAIAKCTQQAEELATQLSQYEERLSECQCPSGCDGWTALNMYPDAVNRVRNKLNEVHNNFLKIREDVENDVFKLQQEVASKKKVLDDTINKYYRSCDGIGVGSRGSAGGSSSSSTSTQMCCSRYVDRALHIVSQFCADSNQAIARWIATGQTLRLLAIEAHPTDLITVKTFAEVLPDALQEFEQIMIQRCSIAQALSIVTPQLEKDYLKLLGSWGSWSAKYAAIQGPLARATPLCRNFNELPNFLVPCDLRLPGISSAAVTAAVDSHLAVIAEQLKQYVPISDTASSPGLNSRQCTATPLNHQFSSGDDGCAPQPTPVDPVVLETNNVAQETPAHRRIAELEAELSELQCRFTVVVEQLEEASRDAADCKLMINEYEASLSKSEGKLRSAEQAMMRMTAQHISILESNSSAGGQDCSGKQESVQNQWTAGPSTTCTPLVKAVAFLEDHFERVVNELGLNEAFSLESRNAVPLHEIGTWNIPSCAPPLVACNHFAVRVHRSNPDDDIANAGTPPVGTANQDEVTSQFTVTLRLRRQPAAVRGPSRYKGINAEIHEGNTFHHLSEVLLNKACLFERTAGEHQPARAVITLPSTSIVRPDLRDHKITVMQSPGCPDGNGSPMSIVEVNALKYSVSATCST
jgi:hypothetical protein